MVLAARSLGIPAALAEADAHLGLANRLALPFAQRVFLAYPLPGRSEPRFRVVGRSIPARSQAVPRHEARRLFDLPEEGSVLLVYGALAGATALNELVLQAFGDAGPAVLHLAGRRDYESMRALVRREDYRLLPETEHFGAALSAADLVVARSGGSVWELAAAGTPAILVPYPFATGDHQAKNAQHFVDAGGALMVRESELPTVPGLVRTLLGDPARRARMAAAMRAAARPDAAAEIADELIALAASKR